MRSPASTLLADHGAPHDALLASQSTLRELLAPESADWRLRLSARGGDDGDLALLLAICRSADAHAYQVLEHCGVRCAALRRDIIERMRAEGEARLRAPAALATATPPRIRPRRASAGATPSPRASVGRTSRRHRTSDVDEPTPTIEREVEAPRGTVLAGPSTDPGSSLPSARGTANPERKLTPIDARALAPLFGRERELEWLADAMGRRLARAPLLVGPCGSGRSLLASHLAAVLRKPVFRLQAAAYDDGDALEHDLRAIAEQDGIAILDDLDRIASDAPPPCAAVLGQAWPAAVPPLLVVSSPEGRARLSLWLPGVMESVDTLAIRPLEGPALEAAVKHAAPAILAAHGLPLAQDAKLAELTRWADRYLVGLAMPSRALDVLDLACARTRRQGGKEVARKVWLSIVSERSGLPEHRIEAHGDHDLLDLEQRLAERVVGHRDAVATIARLVRRNRAGFGGARPILSALLLGPSGVGKTELAKALAEALFERPDALLRLDMSEYAEPHAVARIVGAPPGYVGHEQGGALSDPMILRPHCVVLLDEIEKAHRDVHQLLLQVFDEGRLTDGRGRLVDFRHAAVIMTSNLGAHALLGTVDGGARMDEQAALEHARNAFPLELWNRIEAPLVMHPLSENERAKICRRLARQSSERLFKERGIRYSLSDAACAHLLGLAGRDPRLGARPLRHLLNREVESTLADAILRGEIRAGTHIEADIELGQVVFYEHDPHGRRPSPRAGARARI